MTGINGQMRNGTQVFGLTPHMGMMRGSYIAGTAHNGDPFMRALCWYPDGRLTPVRETEYDIVPIAPTAIDNEFTRVIDREFDDNWEDLF